MSEWIEIMDSNIDVDHDDKEVSILVAFNDWGNVYGTLTFEQVEELYEEIKKPPFKV